MPKKKIYNLRGEEIKQIKCGACGHIGIIVGECATECEHCGASVDMDTGEPYRDSKTGEVTYCGQFGGRHIP
jgi:ribosomal protein S27E